jgi:hypothetical protein
MESGDRETFRGYLRSIPDELLVSVAGDCAWLAGFLADEAVADEYLSRAVACQDEEQRRLQPRV